MLCVMEYQYLVAVVHHIQKRQLPVFSNRKSAVKKHLLQDVLGANGFKKRVCWIGGRKIPQGL